MWSICFLYDFHSLTHCEGILAHSFLQHCFSSVLRFAGVHLCKVLLRSHHSISFGMRSGLCLSHHHFLFFVFRLAAVLLIIILLHDPVSAKLTQRLQGVQVWRGKKAVKQIQIITQPCLSVWHVVLISRVQRKLFQQSCGLISCNLLLCCKTFFFFFTEKKL